MTRWRALTVGLLLLGAAAPARAQDALPAAVQVSVLLKVLSYDRALDRSGSGDVVVAVLYDAASAASTASRSEFVRAFRLSSLKSIGGRSLRLVEINVAAGQVTAALKAQGATAAYLTAGLEQRLGSLLEAARATQVMTLGGSESYARRGAAVAVDGMDGRPQLFINLTASRSCGGDLPSAVLQLAKVIS